MVSQDVAVVMEDFRPLSTFFDPAVYSKAQSLDYRYACSLATKSWCTM